MSGLILSGLNEVTYALHDCFIIYAMHLLMLLHIWSALSNNSNVRVIAANSLHNVILIDVEGTALALFSDCYDVVDTSGVMG